MAKKTGAKAKGSAAVFRDWSQCSVKFPIRVIPDVPILRRHDFQITTRQALGLRVLLDGLQIAGEEVQLHGLRPVKSHADAIRWILDKVADAADEVA